MSVDTKNDRAATNIIIDCDPGLDDAVTLLLAVAASAINLEAVTTVAGNVGVERTSLNARAILDYVDSDVPVFAGCPAPLFVPPYYATYIHGTSGLQDLVLPEPVRPIESRHAVELLTARLTEGTPRSVSLCMIAPLTNLAVVLIERPELALKIRDLTIMGGAIGVGNTTPAAEFNVFVDPHAAHRVFEADIPITLVPLDVTESVVMDRWRLKALHERATPIAELAARIMDRPHPQPRWGERGIPIHDACAVSYLIWPELFDGDEYGVKIDVSSGPSRGNTVVDVWRKFPDVERKIRVLRSAQVDTLLDRIIDTLASA
jgi:purine nucleosidase